MPLPDWQTVVGDTANPLRATLTDANGAAINLSDPNVVSVTFSLVRRYQGGAKVYEAAAEIVDGLNGIAQYSDWTAVQVDESGWMHADFEITYVNGGTLTVPTEPIVVWFEPQRT